MDQVAKKAVLRLFTYGLYVVTCAHGDRWNAFTANWLTQVSFEPPLLALSVENDAVSLEIIRACGAFTVSVFAAGQRAEAGKLGRSLRQSPEKLEAYQWLRPAGGAPVFAEALGYVRCEVRSEAPAGDSTLLLAEVVDAASLREGEPLTMREAGFRHSG